MLSVSSEEKNRFLKSLRASETPFTPDFNVVWSFGVASRQPKRFFSTLAQNTPVAPNIEIGGAGGSMYLFDSRLIRRFFLYLDTEWTMLSCENITSVLRKPVQVVLLVST